MTCNFKQLATGTMVILTALFFASCKTKRGSKKAAPPNLETSISTEEGACLALGDVKPLGKVKASALALESVSLGVTTLGTGASTYNAPTINIGKKGANKPAGKILWAANTKDSDFVFKAKSKVTNLSCPNQESCSVGEAGALTEINIQIPAGKKLNLQAWDCVKDDRTYSKKYYSKVIYSSETYYCGKEANNSGLHNKQPGKERIGHYLSQINSDDKRIKRACSKMFKAVKAAKISGNKISEKSLKGFKGMTEGEFLVACDALDDNYKATLSALVTNKSLALTKSDETNDSCIPEIDPIITDDIIETDLPTVFTGIPVLDGDQGSDEDDEGDTEKLSSAQIDEADCERRKQEFETLQQGTAEWDAAKGLCMFVSPEGDAHIIAAAVVDSSSSNNPPEDELPIAEDAAPENQASTKKSDGLSETQKWGTALTIIGATATVGAAYSNKYQGGNIVSNNTAWENIKQPNPHIEAKKVDSNDTDSKLKKVTDSGIRIKNETSAFAGRHPKLAIGAGIAVTLTGILMASLGLAETDKMFHDDPSIKSHLDELAKLFYSREQSRKQLRQELNQ